MKKPKTICCNCRKVTGVSCTCPPKKAYSGISTKNYDFYNSNSWRRLSKGYRLRHPLCVYCEREGIVKPSQMVDHITPIDKGGSKWDNDNLQALCNSHHAKKTGQSK